jgi:hypothetical protein
MASPDRGLSLGEVGERALLLAALAALKQELGETLTSALRDSSEGEPAATLREALHHLEAAYQLLHEIL